MGIWSKCVVGLEMDSKEIRAVEIKGSVKKPEIVSWGKLDLKEGIVRDGRVADAAALSAALDTLWRENSFKSKNVVFGINNQDVIIRFASFPKVPEDRVRNMIMFQAQDYIPVPLEELQLDYIVVGEKKTDDGEFLQVILVGARKKTLHEFIEAFQRAKLNVSEIDSGLLAIGRAAMCDAKENAYAVVGFNYDMANILIFSGSILTVARSISYSQSSLWTNRQVNEDSVNHDAEESIIADILISELKSSVGYYKMQSTETVEGIYMVNQLKSKSIPEKINEAAGYEVKTPDPYKSMEEHARSKHLQTFSTKDYIVPISLGLRGLGGK